MGSRSIVATGLLLLIFLQWHSVGAQEPSSNKSLELTFADDNGLFDLSYNTAELVRPQWVFFHGDWEWSGLELSVSTSKKVRSVKGKNSETGLELEARYHVVSNSEARWDIELRETKQTDTYGGIAFHAPGIDPAPGASASTPELLLDKSGWVYPAEQNQPATRVSFEPKPLALHFERGSRSEIRAYFLERNNKKDSQKFSMTVSLPKGGAVKPSIKERIANVDSKSWHKTIISTRQTPVDLSFLNDGERPAGKRGFVKTEGENFVFEDGTPVQFWGTNLTAYSLFDSRKEDITFHAKRLAALGFNLVRIHHHDSGWVEPNVFVNQKQDTQTLNRESLDKLDWWIKTLKDEGIYVWLDLHVGREFTKADGIKNFDEVLAANAEGKVFGYSYINTDIQDQMYAFNSAYVTHVNGYTKIPYSNDPAIVGILITNENDLTSHFGNLFLPEYGAIEHAKVFNAEAAAFAKRYDLNRHSVGRTWEHGPSKLLLNDLEHRFNKRMIDQLRGLGVRVPIATTNYWGQMTLASLPALTDGDVIDVHSYGRPDDITADPRHRAGMASWISAAAVAGKPLTVSEWNVEPFPAFDRAGSVPYLAAIARLQNWGAMMQYAYIVRKLPSMYAYPGNYEALDDPAWLTMLPVAALLYRQQHVAKARHTYLLDLPPEVLLGQDISPANSRAIRTITEKSALRIVMPKIKELPWVVESAKIENVTRISDLNLDVTSPGASKICSDTDELCRNWEQGTFTLNTTHSQIASGWLGGRTVELDNLHAQLRTANATVALQSLDGETITESSKLLISLAAQSEPDPAQDYEFLSEPVTGTLRIRANSGLKAYAIAGNGNRRALELDQIGGIYELILSGKIPTYTVMLERD